MNPVILPNLPQGPVASVIVDGRIPPSIYTALVSGGIEPILTMPLPGLPEALAWHPDMQLHHVRDTRFVVAPGLAPCFLDMLESMNLCLIRGKTVPVSRYPGDIAYNAARVGSWLFHNLKHTDPILLCACEEAGVRPVHVNQGYAKCSVSVVDDHSLITADRGIAAAAVKCGLDVLLIPEEKGIRLPGLGTGFIGGCSGLVGRRRWAVAGSFGTLDSAPAIMAFFNKKGIEIVSLGTDAVIDTGSILPVSEV